MKQFWLKIIKPKAHLAKWLMFILLAMVVALGASGYFEVIKSYTDTDKLSFKIAEHEFSLYGVFKSTLILVLLFWSAAIISDLVDVRINQLSRMRAANRALAMKASQIAIYFISFLLALDMLGIDLTTLKIFSGALGIGLGFGLQKIASNFISGIILLMEKSVEQDDLVEMGDGTTGFIRRSSARFTVIETFDGKEVMVPNEDFITNRVVNWTYSDTKGRIEIPIGVAYGSDIQKAHDLILEAATENPLCISDPAPFCYLRNFGDSSVDFILHLWIADVTGGRWKTQSQVMFEIWRKFKANEIEIPFPQRDLHLKSSDVSITSNHES
ncbi:MAG: mechanosensitive ion channel [Opitutae bacterium]|jgi:small-conductance mechanosensitive channel|nr:mechanosensitive ion channel [Opitutae bacterium]